MRYNPRHDQSGRTLTASVKGATSRADGSLGSTLELVLGSDYSGLLRVNVPGNDPSGSSRSIVTADIKGCI